jgi:DNA damage-binding protein 1
MCVAATSGEGGSGKGQSGVVTCSGGYNEGSIRIVRRGIGIAEQASMQLVDIKGVWALEDLSDCDYSGGEDEAVVKLAAARGDKYLVQSFAYETRVLVVDAEEGMSECEIPGLANCQTMFCGNMAGGLWVQATQASVRLICGRTLQVV